MLYLLDFIFFTGLFQGNATTELGSCREVFVKMLDCAYAWEFGLSFFPSAFIKVVAQAVESSAPAREGSTIPLHSKE